MRAYFEYLRLMFIAFFKDLGIFFKDIFASPWGKVPDNFAQYGVYFNTNVGDFGFWGWFFFVLFAIIVLALIGGIIFLIFILLRKYIRFVKKELDKEDLRMQVERLNYELFQAIQEKDKILNLKVGYMGLTAPEDMDKNKEIIEEVESRFPKLKTVDHMYANKDMSIPEVPDLTLEELCNSFRHFAANQLHLYYTIDTIRQLFAGLATSKLIILEGISGTGKTSMPYALGKFFGLDANICSVQPSWKDRSELLGYYNEFTKKFNESEFLRALYEATYRKDTDIIVLDEMNLARVEYYFAEFLSVMEMPDRTTWKIELINNQIAGDPDHFNQGKLLIPQNAVFFGTANNDDSTFTISDKVYDRAISLFFADKGIPFESEHVEQLRVPYSQIEQLYIQARNQFPVSQQSLTQFEKLDRFVINNFKLAFGNRILKQLTEFVPVYVACGGTELDGFDFIFTNKILKKFESLNIVFLRDELRKLDEELDKLYGKKTFPMAHNYIANLLKMS